MKLNSQEKMGAALGARGLIKKGVVPEKRLAAFTKFLRTKKGVEWAKIHLTPIKTKKK